MKSMKEPETHSSESSSDEEMVLHGLSQKSNHIGKSSASGSIPKRQSAEAMKQNHDDQQYNQNKHHKHHDDEEKAGSENESSSSSGSSSSNSSDNSSASSSNSDNSSSSDSDTEWNTINAIIVINQIYS